jgi:hypothetical protein
MYQCDAIRAVDPLDPTLADLNNDIAKIVAENKRQTWKNKVEEAGQRAEPTKFWPLLQGLSGKRLFVPPNQPIRFGKKFQTKPSNISEQFVRQYVLSLF